MFFCHLAFAFWMILGGTNLKESDVTYATSVPADAQLVVVKGFDKIHDMCFSLFRLTLVDDYDFDVRPFAVNKRFFFSYVRCFISFHHSHFCFTNSEKVVPLL